MSATARPKHRIASAEGTHEGAFTPADWLLLCAPAVIWSASFGLMAAGLDSYTPAQVAFGRIFFGMLATWSLPAARTSVRREDIPQIVLLGITWMAVPLSLFPIAEQWIDTSLAGMLNAGMPIATVGLGWIFLRRGPHRHELTGVVLGLFGVALVIGPSVSSGRDHQFLGVLCCILAVTSYGVAAHLNVPLVQRYGPPAVMARALSVASVLTLPGALAGASRAHPAVVPTVAILALGVLGTGLAYALAAKLIARVGAIRGSLITYLVPPLSVLWGVLFFDEKVSVWALAGTAVILAGAWASGTGSSRREVVEPAAGTLDRS
jgi:drug/metabolite transporter (DMT)-like permease